MRQETDGVLLESFLIYEPEHEATWFKDGEILHGALDFDEKYQVSTFNCNGNSNVKERDVCMYLCMCCLYVCTTFDPMKKNIIYRGQICNFTPNHAR
jgi:hypothetical protein